MSSSESLEDIRRKEKVDRKERKETKGKSSKKDKKHKKTSSKGSKSKRSQETKKKTGYDFDLPSVSDKKRALFMKNADKSKLVPDNQKVQLEWKDIVYEVPAEERRFARCRGYGPNKAIINGVSGYVAPGEMVAIIGPSGAGKTSLLNILAGRIKMQNKRDKKLTGSILVNNTKASTTEFQRISGFVAQEDVLMGYYRAEECLQFAAEVTLGDAYSKKEKKARVQELLDVMGLHSCKDNFIGYTGAGANNSGIKRGLSGGERKRLSVCMELIHNPRMLFLDEPTSGLDSFAALTVIRSMQKLAFLGRTIICTIHQPSNAVLQMFDKVMVLADGKACYFGKPNQALDYFDSVGYPSPPHCNPADFMLMTVQVPRKEDAEDEEVGLKDSNRAQVDALLGKYKESVLYKDANNPPKAPSAPIVADDVETGCCSGYETSYPRQFALLCKRSWLGVIREPILFRARLIQSIFMGVIAGLIFLRLDYDITGMGDRISGGFFIIISAMFGGINGPTYVFPAERGVYFRERAAGMYSPTLYFISKVLAQLPINILAPTLLSTIAYWMIGFNDYFDQFLQLLLVTNILSNLGFGLGLLLSTAILDPGTVQKVQNVVILPFMLFSGFFVSTENVPPYFIWIEYISFIKYGFRAGVDALLSNTHFYCETDDYRELPGLTFNTTFPPASGVPEQDQGVVVGGGHTAHRICPITSGDQVLTSMGLNYDNIEGFNWGVDVIIVLAMMVAFYIGSWAFLRFRKPQF